MPPRNSTEYSRMWRARNPERAREVQRLYRERQPGKHAEYQRQWNARNPEKVKEKSRRYHAKNREARRAQSRAYYLVNKGSYLAKRKAERDADLDAYRAKKRKYDGTPEPTRPRPEACESCGGPPCGSRGVLHVDHCHVTGVFRGWLCDLCNRGVGMLGDNMEGVMKMVAYLSRDLGKPDLDRGSRHDRDE